MLIVRRVFENIAAMVIPRLVNLETCLNERNIFSLMFSVSVIRSGPDTGCVGSKSGVDNGGELSHRVVGCIFEWTYEARNDFVLQIDGVPPRVAHQLSDLTLSDRKHINDRVRAPGVK